MICTRFVFLDDRADDQLDRRLLKRESVFDASAIDLQHATESDFDSLSSRVQYAVGKKEKNGCWLRYW